MDPTPDPRKEQDPDISEGHVNSPISQPSSPARDKTQTTCDGNDAVCFTAGFAGSMFGAGAIHAYLAADRKPPAIVAGISMGALNASAMQRCYQELEKVPVEKIPEREVARWTWFREYLNALTDEPLAAVWRGLPRQTDLAADLPPIRDTALEEFTDRESKEFLMDQEKEARRELYLFMRLGQWLSRLPLKLSEVADFIVTYVRVKEKVPGSGWRSKLKLATSGPARLLVSVIWHLCFHPTWIYEGRFRPSGVSSANQPGIALPVRPLFGWPIFITAWAIFLPMVLVAGILAVVLFGFWHLLEHSQAGVLLRDVKELMGSTFSVLLILFALWVLRIALLITPVVLCGLASMSYGLWQFGSRLIRKKGQPKKYPLAKRFVQWLSKQLFGGIELKRSLIHNFHLRLRLTRLFGSKGKSDYLTEHPMPAVLVAAPLQGVEEVDGKRRGVSQIWARSGASIVDVLLATLALPGIFPPQRVIRTKKKHYPQDLRFWEVKPEIKFLDLVDGSVIRENPLPALFRFIKRPGRENLAQRLSSSPEEPRVHVVFSVPYGKSQKKTEAGPLGLNIIDVLGTSLRLNRRRDTRLEIGQINFMSELEYHLRQANNGLPVSRQGATPLFPIFADSISPEADITFANPLRPEPREVLETVATGCRRTLERLYATEIRNKVSAPDATVPCHSILSEHVRNRQWNFRSVDEPALPEVCFHCTRELHCQLDEPEPSLSRDVLKKFGKLTGERPRIVFLASGGVFRGSFHAGMLGALLATGIRPDIIVGASVGTLIGGALGAMFSAGQKHGSIDRKKSLTILRDLTGVLLHVDQKIAFTTTLKTAVRELGIRARSVKLSPNDIRRMVRKGARADAGFAATGAPPALIDAFSNLLFLPHRKTSKIAADFVAGNVTKATAELLEQIKRTTLRRLDIEYAIMGVSLLEPTAYRLLGEKYQIPLQSLQPFLKHDIAFFATTTNLLTEEPRPQLLGLELLDGTSSFDLVQAALASSAFPAVFAPRRESDVFPGAGRKDVLLSDGGMFDNLPFFPTIEFLANVQCWHSLEKRLNPIDFLEKRHKSPDLFIAGSLNVLPESEVTDGETYDDIFTTVQRANSLKDNLKILAFIEASGLITEEVGLILKHVSPSALTPGSRARRILDGLVETAVLPVFPGDRQHLNPTYAFSASVGMKTERVQRSIVNGCFQTLEALANAQSNRPSSDMTLAHRSLLELKNIYTEGGQQRPPRVPAVEWNVGTNASAIGEGYCPYFRISPNRFEDEALQLKAANKPPERFLCPFFQAGASGIKDSQVERDQVQELYEVCCADQLHGEQAKDNAVKTPSWFQNLVAPLKKRLHALHPASSTGSK